VVSLHNLGTVLAMQSKFADAAQALRAALAEDPAAVETWLQLLAAERGLHGPEVIAPLFYEALGYCPENPGLLHNLGQVLLGLGKTNEAMSHLWHALRVAPEGDLRVEICLDLAQILQQRLRLKPAELLLREALASAPSHSRIYLNLGALLYLSRRYREAEKLLDEAIRMVPQDPRGHVNRAMVHMALGESDTALDSFRKALALRPDYPTAHSNLLLAMQYSDKLSAADILEETRKFGLRYPKGKVLYANDRNLNRPLRVGYVSGDFRRHVVGTFLLPVFQHHDPSRVEIYAYSLADAPDPMTMMLKQHTSHWVDARSFNDAALAARIRADKIDILVDVSGHTADNRLPMFALQPAPVQVSWLGYPGSIGLPAITHRITDPVIDPPGSDSLCAETLCRLPDTWFCYTPLPEWGGTLPVGPLPAERNGYIRFGAFNNLAKVSSRCLDLWAQILAAVPESRLVVRAKPFDDPAEQERFKASLASRGIAPERIETLAYIPDPQAHMKVYDEVDIHLDSLPYSGGTTSCNALWMGVPVITLAGDRPAACLGASTLAQLGLNELIAESTQDYVQIANKLANNLPRLAEMRATLRQRFQSSPLHDAGKFTRDLEAVFRQLWVDWAGSSKLPLISQMRH
jgi:predicted O-linked N-acetylglucosamine transferase (SPINDLY family)